MAFVEAPPSEKKVDVFSFLLFTLLLNKHSHRKSLINTIKKCSFFCLYVSSLVIVSLPSKKVDNVSWIFVVGYVTCEFTNRVFQASWWF